MIYHDVAEEVLPKISRVQQLEEFWDAGWKDQIYTPQKTSQVDYGQFQLVCWQKRFHPNGWEDPYTGRLNVLIFSEHFRFHSGDALECQFEEDMVTPTFKSSWQFLIAVDREKVEEFRKKAEDLIQKRCGGTEVELAPCGEAWIWGWSG